MHRRDQSGEESDHIYSTRPGKRRPSLVSIEQSLPFHLVRRILRVVEPQWRLMANPNLESCHSAIDHRKKLLEIGENTPVMHCVCILLFAIGQIRQSHSKEFGLYFGKTIRGWRWTEAGLISKLVDQAVKVDANAFIWAVEILGLFWNIPNELADELLLPYLWDRSQWKEYFSS